MSVKPECLENIIGLSETTCSCFTAGKPVQAGYSESGLYLDRLEGLNLKMAESLEDCEEGALWDLMLRAKNDAIKLVKADVLQVLGKKYKKKRQPFSGTIGDIRFTKSLDLSNTYYGSRIYCANIMSGVMTIKRIGLLFDQAASFPIYIYDNISDSPIATYNVTCNPNTLTWIDIANLELPMNGDGAESPQYYIVYQKGSFKPKDANFGCGCGGGIYKYYWDTNNPKFISGEKFRWGEYVMPTGTTGSDISTRNTAWQQANYNYGIILDVEFKCKVSDLICKDSLDYDNNDFAIGLALAVQYKAGQLLLDSILASGNINTYTMTDRERIMGKKNTYLKTYQQNIDWLTENINWKANDCLVCDDFNDIIKTGILS